MNILKFVDNLVSLILSGEKTCTWRMFDEKDIRVGDDFSFINKTTGKQFVTARITAVKEKKFGEISEEDFVGHERFESTEKMYEAYRTYYGDRVTAETVVKIITFNLLGRKS